MQQVRTFTYIAVRLISLVLICIALMLLGADLITTLEHGGAVVIRSLDHVWTALDSTSIDGFKGWLEHRAPQPVSHGVESFLATPGWAFFGVLGVVLAFLFGRRSAFEA
jgi:hypothetical protein